MIDFRYFDESVFCLFFFIAYVWQEKGDTIAIESMLSKRLNVLGFMNKWNQLEVYTFEGTFES